MDAETTEKGMALVEEVLRAFAGEQKRQRIAGVEHSEQQTAVLARVVKEYEARARSDPWVQRALESL